MRNGGRGVLLSYSVHMFIFERANGCCLFWQGLFDVLQGRVTFPTAYEQNGKYDS